MSRGVLLIFCLVCSAPALSGEPPARFEVTPYVAYMLGGTFTDSDTDDEVELDGSGSFGLALNMRADANTEWELSYSQQNTKFDVGSLAVTDSDLDVTVRYLQFGGTYLWEGDLARPFLVATVGLSHFDPDSSEFDSDTYFAFSIGGGVKLWPKKRFGLRLGGRFYGSVIDSDTSLLCRSGPEGSGCLIASKGEMLWQWEMMAGAIVRF